MFNLLRLIYRREKLGMMQRKFLVTLLVSFGILHSCRNGEAEKSRGDIYAKYSIWGEEGKELVNVFFQFQSGGPDGQALSLINPAKVLLDNNFLIADSAREGGVFYELQMPVEDFDGAHTITFIDADKKEYRQEFSFTSFRLKNKIGDTLNRNEMVLNVEGLKENELVRVVITDTSFEGDGVNEMDTVRNNQLDLRKFLRAISNGPINLHLYKEEERLLNNGSSGWGEISITYGLKREFELKD